MRIRCNRLQRRTGLKVLLDLVKGFFREVFVDLGDNVVLDALVKGLAQFRQHPWRRNPRRFTCEAEDASPPLDWSDAPADTRSFVVLCDDPDTLAGTWHHWAAYDIPVGHTVTDTQMINSTHVNFPEPGTLEAVVDHAARWFKRYLADGSPEAGSRG